jgi:hypothetical protein
VHAQQPAATDLAWEARWAPYDEPTYQAVLKQIRPEDVVVDIGAGDLRLARRMASVCRQVIAIERQPALLNDLRSGPSPSLPHNLIVLPGDARRLDFPKSVTTAVLLMRHCTCYSLYAGKLKQAGARTLITNARWKMDVEVIDLHAPPLPYASALPGWYACGCGAVGFKCESVEDITPEALDRTTEVELCPTCHPSPARHPRFQG